VERRERVVRAERVRAVHQAREHLVLRVLVESELAEPRLRDQRDQRGHREAEAALLGSTVFERIAVATSVFTVFMRSPPSTSTLSASPEAIL
jgi:hypothetical protein